MKSGFLYFTASGVFISYEVDRHFEMYILVEISSVKWSP